MKHRVLVVAGWYPSPVQPLDGIFVRDHALAAARDADVVVVAIRRGLAVRGRLVAVEDVVEDGLRVVRIRVTHRVPEPLGFILYLPALAQVVRRLRRQGFVPDVVHGHVFAAGLVAVLVGRMLGIPAIVSEHFSYVHLGRLGRRQRILARAAYRSATIVCPVSESLRRTIATLAPRARMRIVPNPVDARLFSPGAAPASDGPPRALFVGLLDEVKGVDALLRAVAILRDRGRLLRLTIVGDGPRRGEYEALALAQGLDGDAVSFAGALPRAKVAEAMRTADLFVLPSMSETFGTVVAESLCSGLPVVATAVGALPELVGSQDGTLVPSGDDVALADGIATTVDGLAGFDRDAIAARARERFGLDAVAARWGEVYDEALSLRSRRGT